MLLVHPSCGFGNYKCKVFLSIKVIFFIWSSNTIAYLHMFKLKTQINELIERGGYLFRFLLTKKSISKKKLLKQLANLYEISERRPANCHLLVCWFLITVFLLLRMWEEGCKRSEVIMIYMSIETVSVKTMFQPSWHTSILIWICCGISNMQFVKKVQSTWVKHVDKFQYEDKCSLSMSTSHGK